MCSQTCKWSSRSWWKLKKWHHSVVFIQKLSSTIPLCKRFNVTGWESHLWNLSPFKQNKCQLPAVNSACKTSNHCLLSLSSGLVLVFGLTAQLAIPPLEATHGKSYYLVTPVPKCKIWNDLIHFISDFCHLPSLVE